MMRRRKAETLVEFLMAAFIFTEIMTGVLSFIANQTETLVNIRNRDTMMFHAQRFMNIKNYSDDYTVERYNKDSVCLNDKISVDLNADEDILTVRKGKSTMTFNLNP